MKKELLKGVTMLVGIVALAFLTAVASNAQSSNTGGDKVNQLVAVIPFEFSIDYKTMPAGEYVVQTVATAGDALLIQSADGKNSALRQSEATDRLREKSARLVFHRYGERYFLAEVWSGADTGRRLMKSRDELNLEREIANITSKSEQSQSSYETVAVPAIQILAKLH